MSSLATHSVLRTTDSIHEITTSLTITWSSLLHGLEKESLSSLEPLCVPDTGLSAQKGAAVPSRRFSEAETVVVLIHLIVYRLIHDQYFFQGEDLL